MNEKKESALTKKVKVSAQLAAVIGVNEETRGQITKLLWVELKRDKLQDPADGRYIIPNERLAPILGTERLHMTAMSKKISEHILK